MKLKVLSRYRCWDVQYEAGTIIDVSDHEGAFLQRDAPGCFEVVVPEPPVPPPPVPPDKMVRTANKKG